MSAIKRRERMKKGEKTRLKGRGENVGENTGALCLMKRIRGRDMSAQSLEGTKKWSGGEEFFDWLRKGTSC